MARQRQREGVDHGEITIAAASAYGFVRSTGAPDAGRSSTPLNEIRAVDGGRNRRSTSAWTTVPGSA
jgi:hypothetical protein